MVAAQLQETIIGYKRKDEAFPHQFKSYLVLYIPHNGNKQPHILFSSKGRKLLLRIHNINNDENKSMHELLIEKFPDLLDNGNCCDLTYQNLQQEISNHNSKWIKMEGLNITVNANNLN